jgi:type II secretory pathway pseudopilin PulG
MGILGWLILIVVIGALAAAAAYALMSNRRTEAKREEAMGLREEAAQSTASVEASRREAEEAAARAEVARAEAARAEQDAAQAQQGVHVEEARVEDRVRTADQVDPDVDTRAEDYRPDAPTTTAPETGGGTTYADPADPDDGTATDVTGRPLDDASDTDTDDQVHTHQYKHRPDST